MCVCVCVCAYLAWVMRKSRELSSRIFVPLPILASFWHLLGHCTLVDGVLTAKRARVTTMPHTSHQKSGIILTRLRPEMPRTNHIISWPRSGNWTKWAVSYIVVQVSTTDFGRGPPRSVNQLYNSQKIAQHGFYATSCSWLIETHSVINHLYSVDAQSLSNRRGDLDGEKVIKTASKADCVLALNGESCMSQCHEIIGAFVSQLL